MRCAESAMARVVRCLRARVFTRYRRTARYASRYGAFAVAARRALRAIRRDARRLRMMFVRRFYAAPSHAARRSRVMR